MSPSKQSKKGLTSELVQLVDPFLGSADGVAVCALALCWPDSPYTPETAIDIGAGETLTSAAARLDLNWHPRWLEDAGYKPSDAAGRPLTDDAVATADGPISWSPEIRLPKVDDQVKDTEPPGTRPHRRRLAGEVALLAMWSRAAIDVGFPLDGRTTGVDRGSMFRDFLVHYLGSKIPPTWRVEPEVKLSDIRGLHMRKNVGGRSSDIVVIDEDERLVAVVSSKWTWRSDRGTEAAQMVPLMRYRPDIPYALATAEFPRAAVLVRESVEDRAYHACPGWVAAWRELNGLTIRSPREEWPALAPLIAEGASGVEALGLTDLVGLVTDLTSSGRLF